MDAGVGVRKADEGVLREGFRLIRRAEPPPPLPAAGRSDGQIGHQAENKTPCENQGKDRAALSSVPTAVGDIA